MQGGLIVHTLVNEVVDGKIRDITLTVKKSESEILSSRLKISEDCTEATLVKVDVFTDNETIVHDSFLMIIDEMREKGIEIIEFQNSQKQGFSSLNL